MQMWFWRLNKLAYISKTYESFVSLDKADSLSCQSFFLSILED